MYILHPATSPGNQRIKRTGSTSEFQAWRGRESITHEYTLGVPVLNLHVAHRELL